MSKVTLQVPVDRSLKIAAEKSAVESGFSSLQELLRVVMSQIAKQKLTIGFWGTIHDEVLTGEQEAVLTKKYEEAKAEIKAGKGFVAKTAGEMLSHLRS